MAAENNMVQRCLLVKFHKLAASKTGSFIITCFLLCLAIPSSVEGSAAESELLQRLKYIQQRHNIAGFTVIVANHDGLELAHSMGIADRTTGEHLTPQHYVRMGSVSKLFLGLTLLKLEEQGKLSLNQPVRELLEELPYTNPWHDESPLRLVHLLEHTAGLTDLTQLEWDSAQPLSTAEALALDPDSRQLRWSPGQFYSYSNSGAGIAAHIIENETGRPFIALVDQLVFEPIGMTSATYELSEQVRRELMTGYNSDGTTVIPYWHMLYPAFGAINVRAIEMQKLLSLFLGEGQLLGKRLFTAAQIKRMWTPTTTLAAAAGLEMGYGLGLRATEHTGTVFVGHGGDADGYLSYFAFAPALGRGYFVVINAFKPRALRQMRQVIRDELARGQVPAEVAVFELEDQEKADLVGNYRSVTQRFHGSGVSTVSVVIDAGSLVLRSGSDHRRLMPISSSLFRFSGETRASVAVLRDKGLTYLIFDEGNFLREE